MAAPAFGNKLTLQEYTALTAVVASGAYIPPADHEQLDGTVANDVNFIVNTLPREIANFAPANRTKLLGVDYPTMTTAFLTALTAARQAHNPADLIYDVLLGVVIGYTVSRDFANDYARIGTMSMYKAFEIRDRKRDTDPEKGRRNLWVERSDMNSSAIHLIGYMMVEVAPPGSFLAKVKLTKGTPFSPIEGDKEQQKLIVAASKDITDQDREALEHFRDASPAIIRAVSDLFGMAGASMVTARAAADSLMVMEF